MIGNPINLCLRQSQLASVVGSGVIGKGLPPNAAIQMPRRHQKEHL